MSVLAVLACRVQRYHILRVPGMFDVIPCCEGVPLKYASFNRILLQRAKTCIIELYEVFIIMKSTKD